MSFFMCTMGNNIVLKGNRLYDTHFSTGSLWIVEEANHVVPNPFSTVSTKQAVEFEHVLAQEIGEFNRNTLFIGPKS